jgi:nucleotide-binding universal stress UspA family protein
VIGRILIAYDGSAGARRALEVGSQLATALGASVGIVSAVPERGDLAPDDPWSETSAHAAELHEAKVVLAAAGLEAATHEPVGEPGRMIVEVAEDFGYDAIVLGSRELGPVKRAVMGSVSAYVATHAEATVIIAHSRG